MATTNLATLGTHFPLSAQDTALAAAYPATYKQTAPATGATAGIAGSWTPASSAPAPDVTALLAAKPNAVTASPGTVWTTGQYVQTRQEGTAGRAHWNGTAWVQGAKP